jgi:OmcA/MtrC family decaheme c-type cytochrome
MRTRALVLILLASGACTKSRSQSQSTPASCSIDDVAKKTPSQNDHSEMLGACVDGSGALAVAFSARNAGQSIDSLALTQLRFTAAAIYNDQLGTGEQWQSYVNTTETPPADQFPGKAPKTQATSENSGTLEARGGGIYVYRYKTNLMQVTTPVAVSFDAGAVHRVGLEFRGQGLPVNNPTYTWKPSGNRVEDQRLIVETATCNKCHAPLNAHGGARTETTYCVTCHNPGSTDAESGESVDFKVMIHRIHMGSDLPSVQGGGKYVIYGFQNTPADFSTVTFPQPVSNCRTCHNAEDKATPQGDFWRLYPSLQACSSCHDNVAFNGSPGQGQISHPGGPITQNSACSGCHTPEALSEAHAALHATAGSPARSGTPTVKYELSNLSTTGNQPVVTFRVLVNDQPVDLTGTLPAGLSFKSPDDPSARALSPRLQLAWRAPEGTVATPSDNNQSASDLKYGQPRGVSISTILAQTTHNADGSFTTNPGVLGTLPDGVTHVSVGMEGLFYYKSGNRPVEELGGDSAVTATTDPPRREIVDINKCNSCHDRLNAHGGNRANNIQVCVLCHNPNATDRGRRPADPTKAVDGLVEQSIDFREMIHKIHMGENLTETSYVIYGFATPTTGTPNSFKEVRFPGNPANCLTCHKDNTFTVPIDATALATTKLTNADPSSPLDDSNVSPTGAACTACHDTPTTMAHAHTTPDQYSTTLHGTENDNCAQCHGAGQVKDVSVVHPLSSGAE